MFDIDGEPSDRPVDAAPVDVVPVGEPWRDDERFLDLPVEDEPEWTEADDEAFTAWAVANDPEPLPEPDPAEARARAAGLIRQGETEPVSGGVDRSAQASGRGRCG
jgi:hypothetical protein